MSWNLVEISHLDEIDQKNLILDNGKSKTSPEMNGFQHDGQ